MNYDLQVKLLTDTAKLPTKANPDDAGLDLYLDASSSITLAPECRELLSTGISVAIPRGFVGMIRPRSGHAVSRGLDTMAGIIDCGYSGPVKVLLINHSNLRHELEPGTKIAQMLILPCPNFVPVAVDSLDETIRGEKGFGSSGD